MFLIVASNKDPASLNIAKQILNNHPFMELPEGFQGNPAYEANVNRRKIRLITLQDESIFAQDLLQSFVDPELVVFVSKHSSESGTPTLSVHTPGNLNEAMFGGIPRRVSLSPANAMRTALKTMSCSVDEAKLDYEVSYEGTHHGPSLDAPTMFVELGSSPRQWNDLEAAGVVAQAATEAILRFEDRLARAVLGIGGTHYNARFTQMALEDQVAFGHMIPKYAVPDFNLEILRQCMERTLESVDGAVLDWKGIKGENKPVIVQMLDDAGLRFEKI